MSVKDILRSKAGLLGAGLLATALLPAQSAWAAASINKGDTTWMLVAACFVVFMTDGRFIVDSTWDSDSTSALHWIWFRFFHGFSSVLTRTD